MAACAANSGSSSTPSPATDQDYEDTAQTIAASTVTDSGSQVSGGDAIAFRDAMSIASGRLPLGFVRDADDRFHGDRMGVNNDFTIACKNAAGMALTRCDSTTDSATIDIKMSGSFQTPNITASIDREGHFDITGLQSATATINGNSSFSLDTKVTSIFHQGVTSTLTFDNTATYTAITVTTKDHQITGGSASFEVQAHRTVTGTPMGKNDVDKSFDVHAELTFNADHTATLVLDGTKTFKIDLTTGHVTRVTM